MTIELDKFIATGKSHFMCEDYILSGPDYVILSDGCSGCNDTDIGARLLCLSASHTLETWRYNWNQLGWEDLGSRIIQQAEVMANTLFLDEECLAATLMIMIYDYITGQLQIFAYGDGYVILVDNNGNVTYEKIEFYDGKYNNKPFYLVYNLDPEAYKTYASQKITQRIYHPTFFNEDVFYQKMYWQLNMKDYQTIAISSDGLGTFDHNPSDLEIAQECTDFKTTKGTFLQRRMIRAIKNFRKNKIYHQDDITIGAFHREDEE